MAADPVVNQLLAIADLLLGAAHADARLSWAERSAIARVLAGFVEQDELPEEVRARIHDFDPTRLDVERAVAQLTVQSRRDRLELLALVSRVIDADAVLRPEEAGYLRRVAAAIGASEDELEPFLRPD